MVRTEFKVGRDSRLCDSWAHEGEEGATHKSTCILPNFPLITRGLLMLLRIDDLAVS